ncbi:MAG: adenylate cyclase [Verrucomicrobiota bacterium]|nr:adenylate cyclase [Verrucomicrobiota bacterium]
MGVLHEIERKFLLLTLPRYLRRHRHREIKQGYLAAKRDGTQVRVRKAGERYTLTFKRGRGLAREEYETRIAPAQFAVLWPATKGRRLRKTRYDVPYEGHIIEIDIYRGINHGLVVAEVEFRNMKAYARFQPPDWFGREVTGRARYSNVRLARE